MADKCFGCMNKYKFRERPTECPQCGKHFCSKCLDRKKVKENGDICAYCTHKQQKVNKTEDSQILDNFQERYYKHRNQGPPIVTRLQLDPRLSQTHQTKVISSEDQQLEERFHKLRDDHPSEAPSLAELQNQFNKFQGNELPDSSPKDTSSVGQASTKTEFEQAQDLVQQMKEEAELEMKLESHGEQQETDLVTLFNALRGKEKPSEQPNITGQMSIVPSERPEDPTRLLRDLQVMTKQEEESASQEIRSSDIQNLVHHFKPSEEGDLRDVSYPKFLEDTTPVKPRYHVPEEELQQLIKQAKIENEYETEARTKEDEFLLLASKKVSNLIDSDSDSESEVKSKPKGINSERGLEFNWQHFESKASAMAAAAQYDNTEWDFDDEEFDQQVHSLIEQMSAEAELEERLNESGLVLEVSTQPHSSTTTVTQAASSTHASSSGGGNEEDQLPWCCMCNVDAAIRCFDCDGDLYCVPCFSQGHEGFGLFDHRYGPYEPSSCEYKV